MNTNIQRKIDLLAANKNAISKKFSMEGNMMSIVSAFIYTGAGKEADVERLKECRKILKQHTGLLSSFRSTTELAVISRMALSEDPEKYFLDVKAAYDKIGRGKFADNSFMIIAATCIVEQGRASEMDAVISKFNEIYKRMGKEHPFLTSSEDMSLAMLLALTDKSVDQIIADMETCYKYLKKESKMGAGSNAYQALSGVLAIADGNMVSRCDKATEIYKTFIAHKQKYGRDYEFESLGALVDVNVDTETLVTEIIEVADALKKHKGFGSWSIDQKMRLMFAGFLVSQEYSNVETSVTGTMLSSTIAAVIVEEIVIMMCIIAATTAAATANATN